MHRRGLLGQPRLVLYFIGIIYLVFFGSKAYTDLNLTLRIVNQSLLTGFFLIWLLLLLRKRSEIPFTALDLPLIAYFGVRLLSAFWGLDPRVSLESLWRPFIHLLVFYFIVWLFRQRGWRLFTHAFYMAAGVVCIVALVEFLSWYVGIPILPVFQEGWLQIGGLSNPIPPDSWRLNFTLTNATSLSAFLSLLIPPALALGFTARSKDGRIGWFGLVAVALVVQVLNRSRSGVLALGVSLPLLVLCLLYIYRSSVMVFLNRIRQNKLLLAAAVVLGCLVVLLVLAIAPVYIGRTATVNIRFELWRCALNMVSDRPILGVGTAMFGRALRSYLHLHSLSYEQFTTAHNLYLNTAAEAGLLGLAALGWLAIALIRLAWNRWRDAFTDQERVLVAGFIASLVGYAANCMVDTLPETPLVLPVLFLIAWLACPKPEQAVKKQTLSIIAPAVALVLLIASFIGLLQTDRAYGYHRQSQKAADRNEWETALVLIDRAREIDPAMQLYDFQRAFYLGTLAGEYPEIYLDRALDAALATIAIDDTYSLLNANLAALLWQSGEHEAAIRSMERAVETNPPNVLYVFNLGVMEEKAGDLNAASGSYSMVLSQKPLWAGSDFWRSNAFRQSVFEGHLKSKGEKPYQAAELEFYAGFPKRAQTLLQDQKGVQADILLGRSLYELGEYDASQAAFDRAFTLAPRNFQVYTYRAELYRLTGRYDEAEQDARIALFIDPYQASPVHYTLGRILLEQGDVQGAKDQLWKAKSPEFASQNWEVVLYNRRATLLPLKQLNRIAGGTRQAQAWLLLADLYLDEGKLAEAAGIYQNLLNDDPYLIQAREQLDEVASQMESQE